MAWTAPAGASAPYQPPYANPQPGYGSQYPPQQYGQQPPYGPQYQAQQQHPQNGAPHHPPKENRPQKKKGNPVITRYPPPPGYRGPAQPQASYNSNPYQGQYQPNSQQPYQPGYAAPPNYQQTQSYPGPPSYPQNQPYPQGQAYPPQGYVPPQTPYQPPQPYQQNNYPQPGPAYPQYPAQTYPHSQPYQQPPTTPAQPYASQSSSYQGYQPYQAQPTQPVGHTQPAYPPPQAWQSSTAQPAYPPPDAYNSYAAGPTSGPIGQDPSTASATAKAPVKHETGFKLERKGSVASVGRTNGAKSELCLAEDDWDLDFDGVLWPKSNEPVDESLSLGLIIWRPAKEVTRALPSSFAEAEEQALKPAPEKLNNGESVSKYFSLENSHQAFLDVRQTDVWKMIKNDPIFVKFPPEKDMDLIPISQCIAQRDRPDVPVEDEPKEDDDEQMEDANWNVMDNLEQALSSGQAGDTKLSLKEERRRKNAERQPRDSKQEDLLALLGVTGSPKPATNEVVVLSLPPSDTARSGTKQATRTDLTAQRANSYAGYQNARNGPPQQRPYGSMSAVQHARPPPPSLERKASQVDCLRAHSRSNGQLAFDRARGSPARSEGSNHTAAGSDFEVECKPGPATDVGKFGASGPRLQRTSSSIGLKRSYDETDRDNENVRQQDGNGHRHKRRQPQVASVYSRR